MTKRCISIVSDHNEGARKIIADAEARNVIEKALYELAPFHRRLITLRLIHGLEIKTIAEEMGVPESTVRDHLNFAVPQFRSDIRRLLEGCQDEIRETWEMLRSGSFYH